MSNLKLPSSTSPCIGNCCLDEQDMCVGCFRLMDEILIWGQADHQQKKQILDSCQTRRQQSLQKTKF